MLKCATPYMGLNSYGGVSEWPMEHAWKACIRDKRIVGSNPTSSVFSFFVSKKYYALYEKNVVGV